MLPPSAGLGRPKGTQRATQLSGSSQQGARRPQGPGDAAASSEDVAMESVHDLVDDEAAGPEAEFETLLEKRVHADYDKDFGDDFDDDDI
mmetsp:Transcript_36641/g.105443  ORF Transcript_36641/g.105443 Transcript_36641/m.105443 type:complete len:90 (+) Transcript_36641:85-354(+)